VLVDTETLDTETLIAHLTREYDLLHVAVTAVDPATPVPSCPGWTVADLASHVAQVYLHKAECIRLNAYPDPWPPEPSGEPPLAHLERAWTTLTEVFATHAPTDPAKTWFDPRQTVGWWIRRMALETVIHRVDAELAVGSVTPIPEDLALDGIDELLAIFVGYGSTRWPEEFAANIEAGKGDRLRVVAQTPDGPRAWLATVTGDGVTVVEDGAGGEAEVTATGEADAVLRWVWNRAAPGEVTVAGDPEAIRRWHALIVTATQ
jgi:uncharacterized protein (TIGR03083 family)